MAARFKELKKKRIVIISREKEGAREK